MTNLAWLTAHDSLYRTHLAWTTSHDQLRMTNYAWLTCVSPCPCAGSIVRRLRRRRTAFGLSPPAWTPCSLRRPASTFDIRDRRIQARRVLDAAAPAVWPAGKGAWPTKWAEAVEAVAVRELPPQTWAIPCSWMLGRCSGWEVGWEGKEESASSRCRGLGLDKGGYQRFESMWTMYIRLRLRINICKGVS